MSHSLSSRGNRQRGEKMMILAKQFSPTGPVPKPQPVVLKVVREGRGFRLIKQRAGKEQPK
jgi:hypothetical protein